MQIQGNHLFSAPRQAVWDALLDPTVLSMALPGGEQLERVNDNEYKAIMNVKVGPVQGRFEGKVELSNIMMPDTYTMKVGGQGAPGFLNGEGNVTLSDVEGGTLMSYVGDAQVGGKIAGVGQRLIESTAKSIIKQGLAALDLQIQARVAVQPVSTVAATVVESVKSVEQAVSAVAELGADRTSVTAAAAASVASSVAASTESTSAPSSAPRAATVAPSISPSKIALEVAKDVSRDLLSDVIPLKNQEKALWFTVGALAMLLFVILVRLVS